MAIFVDSINMLENQDGSSAPDALIKEIGVYRSTNAGGNVNVRSFSSGKIKDFFIVESETTQDLIPVKKARIFLSGKESEFRDYRQWSNFVNSTIKLNETFLDHSFNVFMPNATGEIALNNHIPSYENFTKIYDTNELVNYNLIAYPHKDIRSDIKRIGEIETIFPDQNESINTQSNLQKLFETYDTRRVNYSGNTSEIIGRQRNIFKLFDINNPQLKSTFPFVNTISINQQIVHNSFYKEMVSCKKLKNIYQLLKNDLSFSIRSFTDGTSNVDVKIFDFIRLITSFDMSTFSQKNNELFLLPEGELYSDTRTDRFENQINTIKFFEEVRKNIISKSKNYTDVIGCRNSKSYPIGYKVEKHLRSRNQQPIQTYYMNTNVLHDTQMKFDREYIYVVKQLRLIVGSAHRYTNVEVPHANLNLEDSTSVMQTHPSELVAFSSSEFKAYVEVELVPSIQIAELEVGVVRSRFIDRAPFPPEVYFYNEKNKKTVSMIMRPGLFDVAVGPNEIPIIPDYFYGKYEIFRSTSKPMRLEDILEHKLVTVDKSTTVLPPPARVPKIQNNMNAHFFDSIVPNKKYYYCFRALTFHNTPSELSTLFQIELLKDSDEYKIEVQECIFKEQRDYIVSRSMKRLIRISPNPDRIFFSREEKIDDYDIGTNGAKLCQENAPKTFKIRMKSKHTGKMIDVNITFSIENNTQFVN